LKTLYLNCYSRQTWGRHFSERTCQITKSFLQTLWPDGGGGGRLCPTSLYESPLPGMVSTQQRPQSNRGGRACVPPPVRISAYTNQSRVSHSVRMRENSA